MGRLLGALRLPAANIFPELDGLYCEIGGNDNQRMADAAIDHGFDMMGAKAQKRFSMRS
jgi:hypothetical protein